MILYYIKKKNINFFKMNALSSGNSPVGHVFYDPAGVLPLVS